MSKSPRIIGRRARASGAGFGKTQDVQILLGDERVEEAHEIFQADVIFQPFGEEQRWETIQAGAMVHAC